MNSKPHNLSDVPEAQDLARLQDQMLRPAKNVNLDGSFEMGWGTMVLLSGLIPYFNAALPKHIWTSPWVSWMVWLPLVCMAFAPYAIPKIIKRFITWPRTGYVVNPNDVKLIQLVMIMIFGLALGASITLPFLLVPDIRGLVGQTDTPGELRHLILRGIEWLICVALTVYLGRKVVTRRQPLPAAYDAALINQRLSQTTAGRKTLRGVKFVMLGIFIGLPILLCGLVSWLMYLSKSGMRQAEVEWPQIGMLSLLIAANALLYLMGNGIVMRQHRWKWLVLAVMLVGPIFIARALPYTTNKPELEAIQRLFPPPVILFIGLVWFVSGGITLISFIRHHPVPAAEMA